MPIPEPWSLSAGRRGTSRDRNAGASPSHPGPVLAGPTLHRHSIVRHGSYSGSVHPGGEPRGRSEARGATPPRQGVPANRRPPSPGSHNHDGSGRKEHSMSAAVSVDELHAIDIVQISGIRFDYVRNLPPSTRGHLPVAASTVLVAEDQELGGLRRGFDPPFSSRSLLTARLEGSTLRLSKQGCAKPLIVVPYGDLKRVECWVDAERNRSGVRLLVGAGPTAPEISLLVSDRPRRTMLAKMLNLKAHGVILPMREAGAPGPRRPQSPSFRQPDPGGVSPGRRESQRQRQRGPPEDALPPSEQPAAPAPPEQAEAPPPPPQSAVVSMSASVHTMQEERKVEAVEAGAAPQLKGSDALLARAEAEHLLRGPDDEALDREKRRERVRQQLQARRDGRTQARHADAALAGAAAPMSAPPLPYDDAAEAAEVAAADRKIAEIEARIQQERDRRLREAGQ
eukprot:TRINITY_DN4982_c1_g1_i1.p1 TRINITY_DN4982_c1_g1~~TRINITY_DN4982_c1_g1_i1.p1  ORF type:complete len:454 (+),score=127.26 TRINITY_DN4982_c1_g1_i1:21-1382(+)